MISMMRRIVAVAVAAIAAAHPMETMAQAYTWTKCAQPGTGIVSPDGTKMVAFNLDDYVYTSPDCGATWTKRTPAGAGVTKNWTTSAMSSDGTSIVVAAWDDFLYISSDSGVTWTKREPAGAGITKQWESIAVSPDMKKMAICANEDYVYTSTDNGTTWTKREPAGAGVSKGWHFLAMSSDGTRIIVTEPEESDRVYISSDSGATWTQRMPAGAGAKICWMSVAISSDGTKLAVCTTDNGHYVYTSSDGGATWTNVKPAGVGQTKVWESVALSSDGAKMVVSATNMDYIYTSSDSGTTWTKNEPAGVGQTQNWGHVSISSDGGKAAASYGFSGEGFYIGTQSVPETVTVAFAAETGGTISGTTPQTVAYNGSCSAVTAVPDKGYSFTRWTRNGSDYSTTNPLTVTSATADMTITANFTATVNTATLTMAVNPTSSGTTTPAVGASTVTLGQAQSITATAATGYVFANWNATANSTLANASSATTTVTLTGNATVTANFTTATKLNQTITFAALSAKTNADTDFAPGASASSGLPVSYASSNTAVATIANSMIHITGAGSTTITASQAGNATYNAAPDVIRTLAVTVKRWPVIFVAGTGGALSGTTMQSVAHGGSSTAVTAIPDTNYLFTKWTGANGFTTTTDNPLTVSNVTSSLTVTANFVKGEVPKLNLKMAVTPDGSGSTSPSGTVQVDAGASTTITATPAGGFAFVGWTSTSEATIDNTGVSSTTVKLTADATVTANFADVSNVPLTMAVSPENSGSVRPSATTIVKSGSATQISATPATGWVFAGWTATDKAAVGDASVASTTVVLTGAATVTAKFSDTCDLSMAVSPAGSGGTDPESAARIKPGVATSIIARPNVGYKFQRWSVEGSVTIEDESSALTMVTLSGNATVSANFAAVESLYLALGSVVAIEADEAGVSEFRKKPVVYCERNGGKIPAAIIGFAENSGAVRAVIGKPQLFYARSDYAGKLVSESLPDGRMKDLRLEGVFCRTEQAGIRKINKAAYLSAPRVLSVSSAQAGIIKITGMYFGVRMPKVYVETTVAEKPKYVKCKNLKSRIFLDAYGKPSCMKVVADEGPEAIGYCELSVSYPRIPSKNTLTGKLVIDNDVGLSVGSLPAMEKRDGGVQP